MKTSNYIRIASILCGLCAFADATNYNVTSNSTFSTAISQASPGDTIFVADGTYNGVTINKSGNASSWIVFKSVNKHGAKITNAGGGYAGIALGGQYIEINGFDVTNPAGHGISAENCSHVRVLNCHSHHNGNSGITGAWGDFYHFEGNITHHNASLSWYSGISIYQAKSIGDNSPGYHTIIRNNISYSNLTKPQNGPHTDGNGIIIDDWNYTQRAGTPYPYEALIENNLCYNNGGGGVKLVWSDNITVRNNTCYNNSIDTYDAGTYRGEFYVQQSRNCKFYNNIGWANKSINSNNSGMMDKAGPSGNSTVANIWANNIFWDGSGLSTSTGDGSTPTMTGNLGVNPLFLNPDTASLADFHVQSTSPAKDAGTLTYGFPSDDLDGNTRPAGSSVDIGCYEYGTATAIYLRFEKSTWSISEAGGTATITVVRTGNPTDVVTVNYATSNGTATAGQDYTTATGTLSYGANVTSRTFSVAVSNDALVEGNEMINLTLSNPTGGAALASPSTAVLTITDNDFDTSAPISFWSDTTTPGTAADADAAGVEVGLRFSSKVAGQITAIRFYKGTTNTGTHIGNIWRGSGAKLATVTFTGETASGWQTKTLATPVTIVADSEYVVSYFAPNGHYASSGNHFSTEFTKGPLVATTGVYKYGSTSAFPNETFGSTNYWVDVVFSPASTFIGNHQTTKSKTATSCGLVVTTNSRMGVTRSLQLSSSSGEPIQSVDIYDLIGNLTNRIVPAHACNRIIWNTADHNGAIMPGMYIIRAQIDGRYISKKLNLIK